MNRHIRWMAHRCSNHGFSLVLWISQLEYMPALEACLLCSGPLLCYDLSV